MINKVLIIGKKKKSLRLRITKHFQGTEDTALTHVAYIYLLVVNTIQMIIAI